MRPTCAGRVTAVRSWVCQRHLNPIPSTYRCLSTECGRRTCAEQIDGFKDTSGEFRFRLKAANGEIIAASEGYTSKAATQNGIASGQDQRCLSSHRGLDLTARLNDERFATSVDSDPARVLPGLTPAGLSVGRVGVTSGRECSDAACRWPGRPTRGCGGFRVDRCAVWRCRCPGRWHHGCDVRAHLARHSSSQSNMRSSVNCRASGWQWKFAPSAAVKSASVAAGPA